MSATFWAESASVFDHNNGAAPLRARTALCASSVACASLHVPIFSAGMIVLFPHVCVEAACDEKSSAETSHSGYAEASSAETLQAAVPVLS